MSYNYNKIIEKGGEKKINGVLYNSKYLGCELKGVLTKDFQCNYLKV